MENNNFDEQFEQAQNYWNELKKVVTNLEEITDYLLTRVQLEREHSQATDFNTLYKQKFTEFVSASYELIQHNLHHSPTEKCTFRVPQKNESIEEILNDEDFCKTIEKRWKFHNQNKETYVGSIYDIAEELKDSKTWQKDMYISEHTVKRYIGEDDDGKTHHVEKTIMELHYKCYRIHRVCISVEKNYPRGPFSVTVSIFKNEELKYPNAMGIEQPTENGIDDFVEQQKELFDTHYLNEEINPEDEE